MTAILPRSRRFRMSKPAVASASSPLKFDETSAVETVSAPLSPITEQQLLLGATATGPARGERSPRRLPMLRRRMVLGAGADERTREHRHDVQRHYEYIEQALLAREMERL